MQFAVILSCMDSRTSVELIFDQGLGDVFRVRIVGNIINVKRTVHAIMEHSPILNELIETSAIGIVAGNHNITSSGVSFYDEMINNPR